MGRHQCDEKLNSNEMGGTCGMHTRKDKCLGGLARKLNEFYGLNDLVVDGRIILIWILSMWNGEGNLDWIHLPWKRTSDWLS
jgi:hypothetical protein